MSMRKTSGLQLQTSIVQDNVPVEISAGLFVGSIHAAFNIEVLKSNNITHVLNVAGSYESFPEDFTYLSLGIRDKECTNLLSCLPIAAVFIDAGLKHGGVLIHCVGGRSRSPAVAMAFLMMKQQMSYVTASAHVKALRPVVRLNAGFDAQLKFLDKARGNVFVANQHLLKARLARLDQQHKDGEHVQEVARKHRQSQQVSNQPPTSSLFEKQFSIEMLASGCDDRGMLGERVPSGCCLSLPSDGYSMAKAGKTAVSSFIPALRSMGTMFGCQCCGESLFCAGAIILHDDIATMTNKADEFPMEGDCMHFLEALRGSATSDNAGSEEQAVMPNITKKPMFAKQLQNRAGISEQQQLAGLQTEDAKVLKGGQNSEHLAFLRRNKKMEQLVSISNTSSQASSGSTVEQVAALVDEDDGTGGTKWLKAVVDRPTVVDDCSSEFAP